MSAYAHDRRQAHDLDYFVKGGVERRSGPWDRRSNRDRRRLWQDRRQFNDSGYDGPERRGGIDRRSGKDRRKAQDENRPARKESSIMEEDNRSIKFKIKPTSYPLIKIYFKKQSEYEDDMLESEVTFPQEFWINLANNCKEVADGMGTFSSQNIVSGLNLMSQTITAEIEAENKRLRNKDAYESLVDFVLEINNRTDLDKVRKGQIIHDKVCQFKL